MGGIVNSIKDVAKDVKNSVGDKGLISHVANRKRSVAMICYPYARFSSNCLMQ